MLAVRTNMNMKGSLLLRNGHESEMTRRGFVRTTASMAACKRHSKSAALTGAVIALVLTAMTCDTEASDHPNIILLLTDDQGWSQVSHQTHPDMPEARSAYLSTPNMRPSPLTSTSDLCFD